ncbi:hypothetical protein COBT_003691 [Conglomerata obtusa]
MNCLIIGNTLIYEKQRVFIYVKITLEDTICPRNSLEYDRSVELQEDFSNKLKKHFFNSILIKHKDTNIKELEKKTFYILNKFFVNYTNLDHFLYTTNGYYRDRFVFRKVCECLYQFLQLNEKDLVFLRRELKSMKDFIHHDSINLHNMYINSDIMFDYSCNTSQHIEDINKSYYFESTAFETILRKIENLNVLHLTYAHDLSDFRFFIPTFS